jgi:hypothetical protein
VLPCKKATAAALSDEGQTTHVALVQIAADQDDDRLSSSVGLADLGVKKHL